MCVCLFSGNIVATWPYERGTPCSSCPSNKPYCEANLCSQQAEAPTSTSVVLVPSFLGLSVLSLINTHNFVIV